MFHRIQRYTACSIHVSVTFYTDTDSVTQLGAAGYILIYIFKYGYNE